MSVHDKYLKDSHNACKEQVTSAINNASIVIDVLAEEFKNHTLDNIPQQFGNFLYTVLGDRITGQRSSVLNTTYIEHSDYMKTICKSAKENKVSIEEQVRKEQGEYSTKYMPAYQRRWNSHHQPQIWITAGRKFGVSYVTGDGKRCHTIYFGAGECFEHLTDEHVDCIKKKDKASCTQDFLDFRDDYVKKSKKLVDCLVDVTIPASLGVISCIEKSPKINHTAGGYRDSYKETYHVLEEIATDEITHISATIKSVSVWDKTTEIESSTARHEEIHSPSYISIVFLKIDKDKETITILGNVDIGANDTCNSLQGANDYQTRDVLNHLGCVEINNYQYTNSEVFRSTSYRNYQMIDSKGVLFNLDEVLKNPTVQKEIKKRMDFYATMSDRLQKLKHEHADLYFVNADI